jgi:hypothetical protein
MIAYFTGLVLTHIALYLMNTAQPALLYLVPCILLSTIITGLCRGELKELYTGQRIKRSLNDQDKHCVASTSVNTDQFTGQTTNTSINNPAGNINCTTIENNE